MAPIIPKAEDLDWVTLRRDIDALEPIETTMEKALRKFKEEPAIPIGCAGTVFALTYGIYNFLRGRTLMSQYMMRTRVVAQGLTLVAVVMSLTAAAKKST